MNENKEKQFLTKLAELLKEYDAHISVDSDNCSDWQGVYGEKIVVCFDSFHLTDNKAKTVELVDGLCLGYKDLVSLKFGNKDD